jgi:hypothetical protein
LRRVLICPACFPNLAMVIAGLTSTSGLTALVAKFGKSMNRTATAGAANPGTFTQAQRRDDMPGTQLETPRIETGRGL